MFPLAIRWKLGSKFKKTFLKNEEWIPLTTLKCTSVSLVSLQSMIQIDLEDYFH